MSNPFDSYRVTSPFGYRTSPVNGKREYHTGIDLVRAHKAAIHAFVGGTVTHAKFGAAGTGLGGFGNTVTIRDKDGRLHLYGHLDSCAVKVGATVKAGQVIGYQGNTGQSVGSHLHYEIRKKASPMYGWIAAASNRCLEPTKYLKDLEKVKAVASKPTSKSNVGKTLYLAASNESWNIYPMSKAPVTANALKTPLRPKKFGGLSYRIVGSTMEHVYIIETSQFGKVQIVVKPHYTGFMIK